MRAPLCSAKPNELLETEVIENPHPFFARLRSEHPISRVGETGVHFVATWDLVNEALSREADFSANLTGVLARGDDGLLTTLDLPNTGATRVIATADEPDHAVHRALAQPRLVSRRIAALEAPLRAWAREALDP